MSNIKSTTYKKLTTLIISADFYFFKTLATRPIFLHVPLMFLILLLFFICAIRADYFDILQKEYKEVITGKVRRFYITAEEEVWDYASQIANNTNVPGNKLILCVFVYH